MVSLAIAAKQKALTVREMQRRMPHTIWIRTFPHESELGTSEISDAESLFNAIDNTPTRDLVIRKCTRTRSSRPYLQGGFSPADESTDSYDVIIPGGVPSTVKSGYVAVIREDTSMIVYTITNINQDWQEYICRLQMEDYGSRRS